MSGQFGSSSSSACSTSYHPHLIKNESGTGVISIADGDDADLMGTQNSPRTSAHLLEVLRNHFLQVARWDPGAVHRTAQKHTIDGQF